MSGALSYWHRWFNHSHLRRRGVLGMNQRNIDYIGRYNPRRLYPLVDDKLKTKRLALDAGLSVPELVGVIESQHQVRELGRMVVDAPGFCIKPAKGSGGKGILVITRQQNGEFYKPNGQSLTLPELERHVSNILAGLYSLGGASDVALIEGLIEPDNVFSGYTYEGVPDTRVIVFRGFPVMAMMRLSTAESHGKANLHQGAVGVGLNIASGWALHAVQHDQPLRLHPDTGKDLLGLQVPSWVSLLEIACACYEISGLGYLGADLVLDQRRGPVLLELNARPGLSIQIANGQGLLPRLRRIESLGKKPHYTVADRVAFAREHFAG